MKEMNLTEFKMPNRKNINIFYSLVLVFFVFFGFLTYRAFSLPIEDRNVLYNNMVQNETSYLLNFDVSPNILYPDGGLITSGDSIAASIVEGLHITLNTAITALEPVETKGSYSVHFIITAEDMWEKQFTLVEETAFQTTGIKNNILTQEIYIPLDEYTDFIKEVEDEVGINSSSYLAKLNIKYNGNITAESQVTPIATNPEIILRLSNRYIEPLGISDNIESFTIEDIRITENSFNLAGIKIPMNRARLYFILITLLLFFIVAIKVFIKSKNNRLKNMDDSERIEQSLKRKMVELNVSPNFNDHNIIILKSHQSLLKIADESEQPILVYRGPVEINYYVPGTSCVYLYILENDFNLRE